MDFTKHPINRIPPQALRLSWWEATLVLAAGFAMIVIAASTARANPGEAYITNRTSQDISVLETLSPYSTVLPSPSSSSDPQGVAITPDGTRAYVTNADSDEVRVFDTSTKAQIGTAIDVGDKPMEIAITPDGKRGFVTNFDSDFVSVIDTDPASTDYNTEITIVQGVGYLGQGIAITPNGSRAYVTRRTSVVGNRVRWIKNLGTTPVVGGSVALGVGSEPVDIAITPDGTRAYVANWLSTSVTAFTIPGHISAGTIGNLTNPVALDFSPDGSRLWVASYGSNHVKMINTATGTALQSLAGIPKPRGLAVTPDGSRVFVANELTTGIATIIDTTSMAVTTQPVGSLPQAVAMTPTCDLAITKTMTPTPLVSGQTATVQLVVTNAGTNCKLGTPQTVVEDLQTTGLSYTGATASSGDWTCSINAGDAQCTKPAGPIAANYSATISITATVTGPGGIPIDNCAQISNAFDHKTGDNVGCASATPDAECDLGIVKTMTPDPVISGQTANIQLNITNHGGPCHAVGGTHMVADSVQPGISLDAMVATPVGWNCNVVGGSLTCFNASTIPLGYSTSIFLEGTVTGSTGSVTNCAEVEAQGDANPNNDLGCDTVEVIPPSSACDLAVVKKVDPLPMIPGQQVNVTIKLINIGGGPCHVGPGQSTALADSLSPSMLSISTPTVTPGAGWGCTTSSTFLTCSNATTTLIPGATVYFEYTAVAGPASSPQNHCSAVYNPNDINPLNDIDCETI